MVNTKLPGIRQQKHQGKYRAGSAGWEAKAANLLKAELKRHGITYAQLVERLADIGVDEKEVNIRNKLARGKFSAVFLIQCMSALGTELLRLD